MNVVEIAGISWGCNLAVRDDCDQTLCLPVQCSPAGLGHRGSGVFPASESVSVMTGNFVRPHAGGGMLMELETHR
jgi:hypothetical protein